MEAAFPALFKPALEQLKAQTDRSIDKTKIKQFCSAIFTQESALRYLGSAADMARGPTPLPPTFKAWPDGYTDVVKFVLSEFTHTLSGETFATHEEMIKKLQTMQQDHQLLAAVDMRQFFEKPKQEKMIATDQKIDLSRFVKKDVKFTSYEALERKREGVYRRVQRASP